MYKAQGDHHADDGKEVTKGVSQRRLGKRKHTLVDALHLGGVHGPTKPRRAITTPPFAERDWQKQRGKRMTGRDSMPGAGFEPAKQYAEELESTPFDHSGTPASALS